ncbi:MAG: hypothetical protein AAB869_01240 [Patescibacteria group bacterium]
MITRGTIVVHRNSASPFPMYFYAIKEHDHPWDKEFPGHPGLWYGLYVLPDFLALQVEAEWQQFHSPDAQKKDARYCSFERRFVVDVLLSMYASLNEKNIIETFVTTPHEQEIIRTKTEMLLFGGENEYETEQEMAFINHPEYLAAFKLTKRAQGLKAYA